MNPSSRRKRRKAKFVVARMRSHKNALSQEYQEYKGPAEMPGFLLRAACRTVAYACRMRFRCHAACTEVVALPAKLHSLVLN
jgi:hypothetical protein